MWSGRRAGRRRGQRRLPLFNELLSPENQKLIAQAVRDYQVKAKGSAGDFKQAIKQEIDAKQKQHDALLANLSSGVLPAPVAAEIGQKIETLMSEIEALKNTPPPKDFTVERVVSWLEALKSAPDDEAIPLLIERIDVKTQDHKIEFNIKSTLNALLEENWRFGFINEKPTASSEVVGETGCGAPQHTVSKDQDPEKNLEVLDTTGASAHKGHRKIANCSQISDVLRT